MKESRCIGLVSTRSIHISYTIEGISNGEPWYYGRIPIRTWVELPSSYARQKSGQTFILLYGKTNPDMTVQFLIWHLSSMSGVLMSPVDGTWRIDIFI